MLKQLGLGLFGLILSCGAAAATCSSYTTLSNGSIADATQVMANFNCAALTSGSTINNLTLTGSTTNPGAATWSSSGIAGLTALTVGSGTAQTIGFLMPPLQTSQTGNGNADVGIGQWGNHSRGGNLILYKFHNDAIGSHWALASGNTIGTVDFVAMKVSPSAELAAAMSCNRSNIESKTWGLRNLSLGMGHILMQAQPSVADTHTLL